MGRVEMAFFDEARGAGGGIGEVAESGLHDQVACLVCPSTIHLPSNPTIGSYHQFYLQILPSVPTIRSYQVHKSNLLIESSSQFVSFLDLIAFRLQRAGFTVRQPHRKARVLS